MKRTIQIFGDISNLQRRIAAIAPGADATFTGSDMDYVVELDGINHEENAALYDELGEEIYGDGEFTLAGTLIEMLRDAQLRLATAESCTGGMVASEIVGISGASDVLYEGLVTYSNEAKMARLGVSPETLANFGAVSEETAIEMATGLLADGDIIGISTTGIAGPGGGSAEKPVGLVYMAVASTMGVEYYRHVFTGGRNEVRHKACNAILFHTIQHIKKYFDEK